MSDAIQKITAAAGNGLTRAEVIATVLSGRQFTAAEQTAFDKARGIWKLREAKRKAEKKARGPLTGAERVAKHRDAAIVIDAALAEARTHINTRRRDAAERNLTAWIKTYCVGTLLNDPPPAPHGEKILHEMDEAVMASRPYSILVARGGGKTSYTECCAAYAIATGKRKFCLVSSINAKQAQQILREMTAVFTSDTFAEDYPDIAVPIKLLDGHGRRSQRYNGRDTKVRIVTEETLLPTIIDGDGDAAKPSRASGACIRAKALKSVRGTKNGTQRPDLIILDDLQTREIAENEERVADVLNLIRGDVMGLAGKGKAAIISTATTIAADDLTEKLATDPVWKTTKNPAILSWPKEWAKDDHGLWGEYFAMFDDENAHDMKHTRRNGSLSFYRRNRAAMDAGADILNWENFDRKSGQISGLQKLMDAYHQMGHAAFMAEYQMEPQRLDALFEITPKLVMSRVRKGTQRGETMPGCVFTCAATDINPSYALSTTICSFDIQRTCFVRAYFVERCNIDSRVNDTAYNGKIYDLLTRHVRTVAALGVQLDAYGIDCNGKQWDAVTRFAYQSRALTGVQITAMVGRAGRTFNPNVNSRIRNTINDTTPCRDGSSLWMQFNADTYREQMQRSWGAEPGAAGGCSLYDGDVNHSEFAVQISNERLIAKQVLLSGHTEYRWKTKEPHDFGDCLSMCYALAGSRNITGGTNLVLAAATAAKITAVNEAHIIGESDDGIVIGCDF